MQKEKVCCLNEALVRSWWHDCAGVRTSETRIAKPSCNNRVDLFVLALCDDMRVTLGSFHCFCDAISVYLECNVTD